MKSGLDPGHPRTSAGAGGIVVGLAVLLPFAASVLFVRSYGVDVFYADEWDFVGLLREGTRGTLGLAHLLAHHNEHVYLVPWGLMLLLGTLTGYDTVPLMYLVLTCLLATSLTVYLAYARTAGRSVAASLLFVPVPLLLFSLRQHENMLWGNQISFALAQTFAMLALYLLYTGERGRLGKLAFPSAALCAGVASCSAAPGLLTWPVGLLVLVIQPPEEGSARRILGCAWAASWAVVWGVYLTGYRGTGTATPSEAFGQPVASAEYLLTLAGGSLFWSEGTAFAAGALLALFFLAALALAFGLRKVGENVFWISVGSFSLLSLLLIAAGRSAFGEELFAQAMLSRYAAFSIPGVVALYGLLASLALNARSRVAVALLAVLLVVVVAGVAHSYPRGTEAGRSVEDSRRQAARILAAHGTEPLAAFTIFGNDPRRVQRHARFLDKRNYSTFREPGAPAREKGERPEP